MMNTQCCNKPITGNGPVYYNSFNGYVQCHMCGQIYEPKK